MIYWSSEDFYSQFNCYHRKYWNLIHNMHIWVWNGEKVLMCVVTVASPPYTLPKYLVCQLRFLFVCFLLLELETIRVDNVCCCCREIEMGSCCCNLQSAVICQADSANFSIKQFLPFLLTFAISPPRLGSGITFIFFHEDFIKVFIVLINWNFVKETEWWKQTTRKSGGWL